MTPDKTLRRIRKESGLTQEQLARDLNVSFSTLNRWENGHASPSRLARMRLVDYCVRTGVSRDIISELEQLK
jgi:transcriptional regulator with XRE-family HTH domain